MVIKNHIQEKKMQTWNVNIEAKKKGKFIFEDYIHVWLNTVTKVLTDNSSFFTRFFIVHWWKVSSQTKSGRRLIGQVQPQCIWATDLDTSSLDVLGQVQLWDKSGRDISGHTQQSATLLSTQQERYLQACHCSRL